jgi:NAD(P)-dependent dehydrogenase (short-subunit alcohol dehydrogenase family)
MIVVITGCSTGFGRSLVSAFLREGWTVVATLRNLESRRGQFAEEQSKFGARLHLVELDVNAVEQRQALKRYLLEHLDGRLDCLVNNAGRGFFGPLADFSEAQIREQMETNFFSMAMMIREFLPLLMGSRGRMINLSSVMGYAGMGFSSLYNASKFAVEGLTESLYYELRPHGVQVGLVEPGAFRTDFGAHIAWAEPTGHSPFQEPMRRFIGMRNFLASRSKVPSPQIVVESIVRIARCKRLPLRTRVGTDARATFWAKRLLPERFYLWMSARVIEKLMVKGESQMRKVGHAPISSL